MQLAENNHMLPRTSLSNVFHVDADSQKFSRVRVWIAKFVSTFYTSLRMLLANASHIWCSRSRNLCRFFSTSINLNLRRIAWQTSFDSTELLSNLRPRQLAPKSSIKPEIAVDAPRVFRQSLCGLEAGRALDAPPSIADRSLVAYRTACETRFIS